MKEVTIYTDGACSNNPGIGGWGAILFYKNIKKEISGGEKLTTNNRMELQAVISALSLLKESCNVTIYSDSAYVVNAFLNDWITNWKNNNWKTADRKPVQNQELWTKLLEFQEKHTLTFVKVKGHADNQFNNRCDELARAEVEKIKLEVEI